MSAAAANASKTPTVPMSPNEMFETLTGYDEIAIDIAFGRDWRQDIDRNPVSLYRAMAFIHFRRQNEAEGGKTRDDDAKRKAMGLTTKQAFEFFEPEAVEMDEDDPETEQGKDATPAE